MTTRAQVFKDSFEWGSRLFAFLFQLGQLGLGGEYPARPRALLRQDRERRGGKHKFFRYLFRVHAAPVGRPGYWGWPSLPGVRWYRQPWGCWCSSQAMGSGDTRVRRWRAVFGVRRRWVGIAVVAAMAAVIIGFTTCIITKAFVSLFFGRRWRPQPIRRLTPCYALSALSGAVVSYVIHNFICYLVEIWAASRLRSICRRARGGVSCRRGCCCCTNEIGGWVWLWENDIVLAPGLWRRGATLLLHLLHPDRTHTGQQRQVAQRYR